MSEDTNGATETGAPEPEAAEPEACLFCRIVAGEVNADVVYEDDAVIAFRDIQPKAPTHVLVVPRHHVRDWHEVAMRAPDLPGPLFLGVAKVADALGLEHYRVVSNRGEKSGQSVFHLHLHVLGGRPMLWPPG